MKKPGLVPPIEFLNRDTHPRLEYFDKILSNWFIDFFEGIDITPTTRDIFLNSLLLEYEGICRNYENFYLETRNAAFIWKCVSELGHFSTAFKGIFHNAFPDFDNYPLLRPLPIWIMNYFVTSSIGIDGLIERMPPPISDIQEKTPNYVKPGKLVNELPNILGLTRKSVNNLKEAHGDLFKVAIVLSSKANKETNTQTARRLYHLRRPTEITPEDKFSVKDDGQFENLDIAELKRILRMLQLKDLSTLSNRQPIETND